MNKEAFLAKLRAELYGLPQRDVEEQLSFYREMIEDRMEEGRSEEEAVAAIGPPERVAEQIIADTPVTRLVKERVRPKRRMRGWEILLLILGAPLWATVLILAAIPVLTVYFVLWTLVITVWAVEAALVGAAGGGIAAACGAILHAQLHVGLPTLGGALICGGLSVFLFFACKGISAGMLRMTGSFALWLKSLLRGKEEAI